MKTISRREILRYLGHRGPETSEMEAMITAALKRLEEKVQPRSTWRIVPLEKDEEGFTVEGCRLSGNSLAVNLSGCTRIALMACTLGGEADRLIAREQLKSMYGAAVMNACANAMIEACCDEVNVQIKAEAAAEGDYCRPRYSPGYGDLPLFFQKDFFRLLPVTKEIGVELKESMLMVPEKSVTALIGMSRTDSRCTLSGCEACSAKETCGYSRMEK